MQRIQYLFALSFALGLSACGPAKVIDDPVGTGTDEAGDESTSTDSGTSTDTSTSTDSSSSEEEDSADFIPPEDTGPWEDPCDLFEQDCPEGEKCAPYSTTGGSWDATKCVPILGDKAEGEPCTYDGTAAGTDDCDGTGMCFNTDQDGAGTCHSFCIGSVDSPTCPEVEGCGGLSCLIGGDSTVAVCVPGCDALDQESCGEGMGCYWVNANFQCVFAADTIPTGQPCAFVNDCAPGNLCVNAEELPSCEGDACCAEFCELGLAENPCSQDGTVCVDAFAGVEDICAAGVCMVEP